MTRRSCWAIINLARSPSSLRWFPRGADGGALTFLRAHGFDEYRATNYLAQPLTTVSNRSRARFARIAASTGRPRGRTVDNARSRWRQYLACRLTSRIIEAFLLLISPGCSYRAPLATLIGRFC